MIQVFFEEGQYILPFLPQTFLVFLYHLFVEIDQLNLIMKYVGTPGPELLMKISSESVSFQNDANVLCFPFNQSSAPNLLLCNGVIHCFCFLFVSMFFSPLSFGFLNLRLALRFSSRVNKLRPAVTSVSHRWLSANDGLENLCPTIVSCLLNVGSFPRLFGHSHYCVLSLTLGLSSDTAS